MQIQSEQPKLMPPALLVSATYNSQKKAAVLKFSSQVGLSKESFTK